MIALKRISFYGFIIFCKLDSEILWLSKLYSFKWILIKYDIIILRINDINYKLVNIFKKF